MTAGILFGSVGDSRIGARIAKDIIKNRLASCIHLYETTSFCKNGKGQETVALIKTDSKSVDEILKIIKRNKVPEFLFFPAKGGWKPYREFLEMHGK